MAGLELTVYRAMTSFETQSLLAPFRPRLGLGGMVCLTFVTLAACKVSEARIKEWRDQKDARRLSLAVADGKQPLKIRTEAAHALVAIDQFYSLERGLKASSEAHRGAIADVLASRLLPLMEPKGTDEATLLRTKDGLFSAWFFASPDTRRSIEETLVRWIVEGPHGTGGEHKIDRILKSFGRLGANRLAELVPPDHPELFVYHRTQVVAPTSLLGYFWKAADPGVRVSTTKRYIATARAKPDLALAREGALFLAIAALGTHEGVAFLEGALRTHPQVEMRAAAVVALRIAAQARRELLGDSVRNAALSELERRMTDANAGKPSPNTTWRGISYLIHLFELTALFNDEVTFARLSDLVGAPSPKLTDTELADSRTALRLFALAYLMKRAPARALKMAYSRLPQEETYHLGYLTQSMLDTAIGIWREQPQRRADLLSGLRLGLSQPSWVARIIGIETLGLRELMPRDDLDKDISALKAMTDDTARPQGDDWRGATLGDRAKKAVESLGETK